MPGRQWCVPGRREVRELLIVGIGVALGHLVKDCRHGKTVGGLCREGKVERKEHSYREYDVWRCLDGSVVRLVGVRHRGRLVGSFRGVRHRGRLVGSFRGGDPLVGKVEICQKSFDSKTQIAKKKKGQRLMCDP